MYDPKKKDVTQIGLELPKFVFSNLWNNGKYHKQGKKLLLSFKNDFNWIMITNYTAVTMILLPLAYYKTFHCPLSKTPFLHKLSYWLSNNSPLDSLGYCLLTKVKELHSLKYLHYTSTETQIKLGHGILASNK